MKVNKIASIDGELVERLRLEKNASYLINNLLWDYYNQVEKKKELTEEEWKDKKVELETQIRIADINLERLEKKKIDEVETRIKKEADDKERLLNSARIESEELQRTIEWIEFTVEGLTQDKIIELAIELRSLPEPRPKIQAFLIKKGFIKEKVKDDKPITS